MQNSPTKGVCASDPALITAYMGLASGGNKTASFDFELS